MIRRPLHRLLTTLKSRSLKRDVLLTSALSVAGRGLGLAIPIFIAYWYGSSPATDAFFLAYSFMLFFSTMIGNILEMVVVPYVADLRARGEKVDNFVGCIVFRGTVLISLISLIAILAALPVLRFGTELNSSTRSQALLLTLEMVPMLFFVTWINVANGVMNAYKNFYISAFSPFFRSVTVLVIAFLGRQWLGVHALAVGFVLGEAVRWIVSDFFYRRTLGPLKWRWQSIPEIKPFFRSALFQAIGFGFISVTTIIDQLMASWAGPGSISIYTYADRLYRIPFQIVITGVASVLLTHWAHDFKFEKRLHWKRIRRLIWRFMSGMGVIFVICFLMRGWIVEWVLNNGEFPEAQAGTVADLFGILVAGLPFQMINLFCIRLLVIYERNKFYMVLGFIRLALDVILNYVLMQFFGVMGIAVATTVLNMLFSLVVYRKVKAMTLALEALPVPGRPVSPAGGITF